MTLAAACLAVLAACGGKENKPSASQVALRVNGQEVSVHQAEVLMQRQAAATPAQPASAVARQVVADLVDQELAAQAARAAGLENDPRVIQLMEAAKREVLASAYQRQLGESAVEPTADEIDAYYDKNPALFAQRRLYALRETYVNISPEQLAAATARLQATKTAAQVSDYIREQSFAHSVRNVSMSAEDLPFAVLGPLAALAPGQSLVLPRPGGLRVVTVLDAQLAPMDRATARRFIASFIVNQKRQALQTAGMKALRDKGKVEYLGTFEKWAPPAATPAASAAQR